MAGPVNLLEYEAIARGVMSRPMFDFVVGGSQDEVTLRANRESFNRWRLVPRVLTGVDSPSLATTVLGEHVSLPVLVSPMGLHRVAHAEGELASAAGAQRAGTIFCFGVASSTAIEEVAAVAGRWWFQLYLLTDRGRSLEHVRRAEQAGASAIVLTVDVAVRGRREADERNRFGLPPGVTMPNLIPVGHADDAPGYPVLAAWDKAITWRDLEWLVNETNLPVVVKGVLAPEDAHLAIEHGAKAVIVSNHGGRQLDSAIASLDALPAIAEMIGDRGEVYLDGGVRRGVDVIKALALGARAVMIGRPVMYGLAAGGEDGVVHIFDLLRQELTTDLILAGVADITHVPSGLVVPEGPRLPDRRA
ncbi:MAG: alpha-hydroxy-acid oxidizing protein [Thermomicrobiales bacterium]|nr:alpha-hydroxy-acid oxidizing protein [Thermomicrobiales bacterium]